MREVPPATDSAIAGRIQQLSDARSSARSMAHDLKGRQVYIRRTSVWRDPDHHGAAPPTLPHLLQGSGSSGTPLKLYLMLLWLAGAPGRADQYPLRDAHIQRLHGEHTALLDLPTIADMLMIPDLQLRASNSGVRRINSALRRLKKLNLIDLSDDERSIRLLAEDGTRQPYTDPGSTYKETKAPEDLYISLPTEFFTCGWFSALPANAVLALLIHRLHWLESRPGHRAFNAETLAKYAPISKPTMQRGERLLTHWSVLRQTTRIFPGRGHRSHYEYELNMARLKQDCPDEAPPLFR